MKQVIKKAVSTVYFPFCALKEKFFSKGSIRVLIYHSVGEKNHNDALGLRIEPVVFRMQMQKIKDWGYEVLDINDIFKKLHKPDKKYLVLTFDDGYKDLVSGVLDILREFNYPAAFFVNIRYLQGAGPESKSGYWEDWQKMGWEELKDIARDPKITVANHGFSHTRLPRLNHAKLIEEIARSKDILEQEVGRRIDFFAYPHGDFNEDCKRLMKESGYRAAFTGRMGKLDYREDIFEFRRTNIDRSCSSEFEFLKRLNGSYDWLRKVTQIKWK